MNIPDITIVGGGLAGCEAAHHALVRGLTVEIHEMKPERFSPAHISEGLAELVCSNSLKGTGLETSSGLLKEEMRLMGSLVIEAAEKTRVPAGGSLAVDRAAFSAYITDTLSSAGARIVRGEVTELPSSRPLIIATGPLTSDAFAAAVQSALGSERLFFYDAVAPIIYADSIDMTRAFRASRHGKGEADFINCPMDEEEYSRFYKSLVSADLVAGHDFDHDVPYFEGCMPVEELASRGEQTLLFGPLRPVGLTDPRTGRWPHAVVQLRRENAEGTLYNMVGFQTRMRYGDQKKVIRMIPGLEAAEFARLGKIHKNTYIDSPRVLRPTLQLKSDPEVLFAGQMTGVEGYVESAASGLIAGINAARIARGLAPVVPPAGTITGALTGHITTTAGELQPMNANFGLLPALSPEDEPRISPDGRRLKGRERKSARRLAQARAAVEIMKKWCDDYLAT